MNVVDAFEEVYTKFKLHFYREVFGRFSNREATLTTVETFCMEVIHAMNMPTVNEFASFINISPPNAAYKVNNLVKKGYLERIPSEKDKREVYLKPTKKYEDYFNISSKYEHAVWDRLEERLAPDELEALRRALVIMTTELMDEVPAYKKDRNNG
ncbi:MAG: MarR family transcriptional regulator [Eubacterium sp.]|nr:MarR family transcriptional regulator [Eubacterium sp.]